MTTRNLDLVAQYTRLAAASGDAWHIVNALEHSQCLEDGGLYDADATISAIKMVRPLAAAAILAAALARPAGRLPTWKAFEDAARRAHGLNYLERGDRYAEPEEMADHISDPLATYELVRDRLIASHGVVIVGYGRLGWATPTEIATAGKAVQS